MVTSVTEIIIYPVKSLAGISLQSAKVEPEGLQHDRRWAIVDSASAVLTAREYPELLQLQTKVNANGVQVTNPAGESIEIPFDPTVNDNQPTKNQVKPETLSIFKDSVDGCEIDALLNTFFSDYLGRSCRLMGTSPTSHRPVAARHGGKPGDYVGFADSCPLLLTNTASLTELNTHITDKLKKEGLAQNEILMRQFRPNIVIQGSGPYTEESWSQLQINQFQFDVAQLCKRCNLATTHPDNSQLHPKQEPLRTLASTRPRFKGGVAFGLHLTPHEIIQQNGDKQQGGRLNIGDVVQPVIG